MTINSQYEGKCKGFKNEDGTLTIHNWSVGDLIFYQREPKCICINQQCFEKQQQAAGGKINTYTASTTDIKAKITRTTDERASDLEKFIETLTKSKIIPNGADCAQVWCRL
jgi:hypothetical protein